MLRQKAADADLSKKEELEALVKDLWDTLGSAEGCGLAAPQIGVSQRVLIVDGREMTETYPYLAGFYRTMSKPVVLEEGASKCTYNEGCLSVPGVYADVVRPSSIKVEYYNEKLEKVTEVFDKFACRMVQHEMSHLDGVIFTDLVAPIRRKMISGKLQNIIKGKTHPRYNSKLK